MHRRLHRVLAILVVSALVASGALAAPAQDAAPRNLIAEPGFEGSAISLRLPAVSPFPLVAGGWGARGGDAASAGTTRKDVAAGNSALQVASAPDSPVHLIQDVPLATRSFVLQMHVQRRRGRQTVRLLSGWDRMDPDAKAAIALEMGARGARITTPDGSWKVDVPLRRGRWVKIGLLADTRDGQLQLRIEDQLVATLPGLPATAPQTLVLGGNGQRPSLYRYDELSLLRLSEIELQQLRDALSDALPASEMDYLTPHLDAAARALARGSDRLATPEIRSLARLLQKGRGEGGTIVALAGRIDALLRLLADG